MTEIPNCLVARTYMYTKPQISSFPDEIPVVFNIFQTSNSGVDPRFPGGANQMEGLQPIIPPIFPENCLEMQTIGPKRGGARVQNFTM